MKKNVLTILLLLFFGILLGIRIWQTEGRPEPFLNDSQTSEKTSITLQGRVIEEPQRKPSSQKIILSVDTLKGRLLMFADLFPTVHRGDSLEVMGSLEKPEPFEDFNYPAYLSQFGIASIMKDPKISFLEHSSSRSFFDHVRKLLNERLEKIFPEPQFSLIKGLLLGDDQLMSKEIRDTVIRSGLSHITAISGYNITLLITVLMALFSGLKKRFSILLTGIFLLFFIMLVEPSASVLRAGIMGAVALLALSTEKKYHSLSALIMAGFVLSIWNPLMLLYDPGFHLSFAATFGLIVFVPFLDKLFGNYLPKILGIRESLLFTLSAQITTLPFLVYHFQNVSIISPLSNMLIGGPVIPFIMLFSLLSVLFSSIAFSLAKLIGFFASLLSLYILKIAEFLGTLPFSSIQIAQTEFVFLLVLILLGVLLVHLRKRKETDQNILLRRLQGQFEHQIFQTLYHAHV